MLDAQAGASYWTGEIWTDVDNTGPPFNRLGWHYNVNTGIGTTDQTVSLSVRCIATPSDA